MSPHGNFGVVCDCLQGLGRAKGQGVSILLASGFGAGASDRRAFGRFRPAWRKARG